MLRYTLNFFHFCPITSSPCTLLGIARNKAQYLEKASILKCKRLVYANKFKMRHGRNPAT